MRFINLKFVAAIAFLMALTFAPSLTANAKEKSEKIPKDVGLISVQTTPGGFDLLVDGKAYGKTADRNNPIEPLRLSKGPHRVEVLFPGKPWSQNVEVVGGTRNCICLVYTRKPLYSPCPYRPTVTAKEAVQDGEIVTFASDVSYTGTRPLAYTWTVAPSNVKIVGPSDGPTLVVDTTGIGDQRVTAALKINPGYGDERCTAMAETGVDVSSIPPPPDKRKFDTSPLIAFDDEKARLDNFAIQLQTEPTTTGYLIVYGGKQSGANSADRWATRSMDYLVNTRGIDRGRLVVVNGGYSDTTFIEMWLVPPGAEPPVPNPASSAPATDQAKPTRKRSR
ncbi:MAG: hypothetical protein ABIP75_13320 [Pyrinomonadaceae bacterium]